MRTTRISTYTRLLDQAEDAMGTTRTMRRAIATIADQLHDRALADRLVDAHRCLQRASSEIFRAAAAVSLARARAMAK